MEIVTFSKVVNLLMTFSAWISLTSAAPLNKLLDTRPSTYRRVKMSHKFGMLAINEKGKVYLTTNTQDDNTLMIIWAYGLQKHRIQGEKSGLNIAMNSKGKVYSTKEATTETLFVHNVLPNHQHIFESSLFKGFFLGFNKQRLPKKGNRARIWKSDRCYFQVFNPNALSTTTQNSILDSFFKDSFKG